MFPIGKFSKSCVLNCLSLNDILSSTTGGLRSITRLCYMCFPSNKKGNFWHFMGLDMVPFVNTRKCPLSFSMSFIATTTKNLWLFWKLRCKKPYTWNHAWIKKEKNAKDTCRENHKLKTRNYYASYKKNKNKFNKTNW